MKEGWRREGPLQRGEHAHVCTCVQSQENLEGISQVLSTSGFLSWSLLLEIGSLIILNPPVSLG